jgi:hypothetical protein
MTLMRTADQVADLVLQHKAVRHGAGFSLDLRFHIHSPLFLLDRTGTNLPARLAPAKPFPR